MFFKWMNVTYGVLYAYMYFASVLCCCSVSPYCFHSPTSQMSYFSDVRTWFQSSITTVATGW